MKHRICIFTTENTEIQRDTTPCSFLRVTVTFLLCEVNLRYVARAVVNE